MSNHISKTITVLRLPLAILVVFIHGKMSLVDWDIDTVDYAHLCNADYYSFIVLAFSSIISAIAVPLFFFSSGYLFFCNFPKWDFYIWRKKQHSRVHTILLPYILWPLIFFILNNYLLNNLLGLNIFSISDLIYQFLFVNRILGVFWFQWNLMFLTCFFVFIIFIYKKIAYF